MLNLQKDLYGMCNDGWEQAGMSANGGNLSYRIKDEEIESVKRRSEL